MVDRTLKDILQWALELLPENTSGEPPYTYCGYPVDFDSLDQEIKGYVVQKMKPPSLEG